MRATPRPAPAALLGAVVSISVLCALVLGSCDYFLMGTYTGLCDEPRSLYADVGEPSQVRMAQCQVRNNICCRKRDPASTTLQFIADKRTFCLNAWECYIGGDGDPCYGDVDCAPNLACNGGSAKALITGRCACPADGVACKDTMNNLYCCPTGSTCGQGSCIAAPPPDMSSMMSEPDLAHPDLRRRDGA